MSICYTFWCFKRSLVA